MEKKTINQVGFFGGKFLYSPTGWPEKPKYDVKCHSTHSCICASLAFENGANRDVVDGYDDNCPHRYQQALSSAIAQAVEFEDQEGIRAIVTASWKRFPDSINEGCVYIIYPTEIEVVLQQATSTGANSGYIDSNEETIKRHPGFSSRRVARLVTQQSEPSIDFSGEGISLFRPVEETQEELWKEVIDAFYYCNSNEQYRIAEEKIKSKFVVTRKK